METHICPKCGGRNFIVSAHVVQGWRVDAGGDYLETTEECIEVTHSPDDEDIWVCDDCGFDAAGSEFLVNEEDKE